MFFPRVLFLVLTLFVTHQAHAAVTVYFYEDGDDLVGTVQGSFNTAAASATLDASQTLAGVRPSSGFMSFKAADMTRYSVDAGIAAFGGDLRTDWDEVQGDHFGFITKPAVTLPRGYVSGSRLSAQVRAFNTSLDDALMTEGVYTNTFTNGNVTETLTVIVSREGPNAASVPATPAWSLVLLGLLAGFTGWRKLKT